MTGSQNITSRFRLDGKVAVITGASKGIGEAMARGLAEFGASVVLCSRKQDAVDAVMDGKADIAFILNPTRIEQVQRVAEHGLIMPRKSTYFYPKIVSGQCVRRVGGRRDGTGKAGSDSGAHQGHSPTTVAAPRGMATDT